MGQGFALSAAAGGMADELQEILKRKFEEQHELRLLAQRAKEAEMRNSIDRGQLDLGSQRLAQDASQFGTTSGQAQQRIDMDAAEQPARLRYIGAQTENLERQPQEAADARAHDFELAGLRGGLELQQIGAQGAQQERIARIRMADNGAAGQNTVVQQGIGPDGNPVLMVVDKGTGQARPVQMPGGYEPNRPARPVSGTERQTLAYYNRAKDADAAVQQFEEGVANAGLGSQLQQQYAPNMLQTTEQQQYRQAQRAFTEARLRKESGAAIPEGEYENDSRTYFAQPGDSPQVREQKRQARMTVLEGLKFASGRAYQEFYGEDHKPAQNGASDSAARAAELLKKYGAK